MNINEIEQEKRQLEIMQEELQIKTLEKLQEEIKKYVGGN